MSLIVTILLVFLLLAILGVLPHWPYMADRGYGYWPAGSLGLVLLVLLVLALLGRL